MSQWIIVDWDNNDGSSIVSASRVYAPEGFNLSKPIQMQQGQNMYTGMIHSIHGKFLVHYPFIKSRSFDCISTNFKRSLSITVNCTYFTVFPERINLFHFNRFIYIFIIKKAVFFLQLRGLSLFQSDWLNPILGLSNRCVKINLGIYRPILGWRIYTTLPGHPNIRWKNRGFRVLGILWAGAASSGVAAFSGGSKSRSCEHPKGMHSNFGCWKV